MAIKHIIAQGIGFSPPGFIVTHGFGTLTIPEGMDGDIVSFILCINKADEFEFILTMGAAYTQTLTKSVSFEMER